MLTSEKTKERENESARQCGRGQDDRCLVNSGSCQFSMTGDLDAKCCNYKLPLSCSLSLALAWSRPGELHKCKHYDDVYMTLNLFPKQRMCASIIKRARIYKAQKNSWRKSERWRDKSAATCLSVLRFKCSLTSRILREISYFAN